MGSPADTLFDPAMWSAALQKFGAVTQLSVAMYRAEGEELLCGPLPPTPLATVFQAHAYDPGLFQRCARTCLGQAGDHRPPVILISPAALAVVGVSLRLEGHVVGALVAGYAWTQFCDAVTIARLAREAGMPFQTVWVMARRQPPVPTRRLVVHGELLQVLGEALLQEHDLRHHAEQTARELTATAAAKEEFLAVLSHELRTPLTPMLGWTSMLKLHDDPKVAHAAAVIERNALLQMRLVEDLLELTRVTRGKLALNVTHVGLSEALHTAIDAVAEGARTKDVAPQFIDAPTPLGVHADADRLQQVFRNVLLNAVKFTPAGGRITVTLGSDGTNGVVRVRDTGDGITPAFLPFVFDMFRQEEHGTRRAHGGLGIGLALVKRLTEAHGGTVRVASDGVGCGTEVTLRFPLASDGLMTHAPVRARADGQALVGLRILVVEDTADARDALSMTLARFGALVVTATDGLEGLERMASERVDLILCDLRMPRMDGFEFLRGLHGVTGKVPPPVIAVSGLASSADHLASQAAGFIAHIDKPVDEGRLLTAVSMAMAPRPTP